MELSGSERPLVLRSYQLRRTIRVGAWLTVESRFSIGTRRLEAALRPSAVVLPASDARTAGWRGARAASDGFF